jgi:hypothetical protein
MHAYARAWSGERFDDNPLPHHDHHRRSSLLLRTRARKPISGACKHLLTTPHPLARSLCHIRPHSAILCCSTPLHSTPRRWHDEDNDDDDDDPRRSTTTTTTTTTYGSASDDAGRSDGASPPAKSVEKPPALGTSPFSTCVALTRLVGSACCPAAVSWMSPVCQYVSVSVCQCISVSVRQCVSVSVCQCVSVSVC